MLTVLIPAFNERGILEDTICRLHSHLSSCSLEHEVLVVSNGSDDGTNELGLDLARKYEWFRFHILPEKGPGRAFVKGVQEARGDIVISLDADLSFNLQFIDYAKDLLSHADMVVGSKILASQKRSVVRVLASQAYILFAQLLLGLTISDYSIGCKAYRRASILEALPYIDPWTGYVIELCVFLKMRKQAILQIGVDCDDRRKSHFNLLYEGYYRYLHLYKLWRSLRSANSWYNSLITLDETNQQDAK